MAGFSNYYSAQCNTTAGKRVNLRISDPKLPGDITSLEARNALEAIIASSVIVARNASSGTWDKLSSFDGLKYTETARTPFSVTDD
ncbi:MAG: DUF2922 domain-containing protein [Clostridiales bacterium]|jgi:hypothetical protein|nr:DUF2922 domain-containing protein [Clostridiales bacterium]